MLPTNLKLRKVPIILVSIIIVTTCLLPRVGNYLYSLSWQDLFPGNYKYVKLVETYEAKLNLWKESIRESCQKYVEEMVSDQSKYNWIWHPQSHLVYCKLEKAATSMMLRILFEMSNITYRGEKDSHAAWPKYFPKPGNVSRLSDTVKIAVVRHPFTRIFSFYIDKMKETYKEFWNQETIKNYRNFMKNSKAWMNLGKEVGVNTEEKPTPWEFVMATIEYIENCRISKKPKSCLNSIDVHRRPFYLTCNPCAFDFDVILKVETFHDDMVYVTYKVSETLAKINKSQKLSEAQNQEWFIKVLNSSISSKKEHSNRGKLSTSEFTRKVFKLLSSEEKNRLRKAYFFDLKLFNYDPYEFD